MVRGPNRSLVVLDHDHRVAQVAQPPQGVDQLRVVALVEADRGLVEDVENSHQGRPDLSRQPDPLCLAPRQRSRGPLQRQVANPDTVQEAQALGDLSDHQAGNRPLGVGQLQRPDPLQSGASAELRVLVDVQPADRDREALGAQAGAAAGRTGLEGHQPLDPLPRVLRVRVLVASLQAGQHAVEAHRVDAAAPEAIAVGDRVTLVTGSVEQQLPVALGEVLPGDVDVDPIRLGDCLQQAAVIDRGCLRPRLQRALRDRERGIGDDQLRVDDTLEAEPVAALATAMRRVEREDPRLQLRHRGAAGKARETL